MYEEKLIEHLTKEIETLTGVIRDFRAKISFTFWVGPFIILGSVVLASRSSGSAAAPQGVPWYVGIIGAFLFASYCAIGAIGGCAERQAWSRCNTWRRQILRLHRGETLPEEMTNEEWESMSWDERNKKLDETFLYRDIVDRIHIVYGVVFLLLGLIFAGLVILVFTVLR